MAINGYSTLTKPPERKSRHQIDSCYTQGTCLRSVSKSFGKVESEYSMTAAAWIILQL